MEGRLNELERENCRLKKRLEKAEIVIDLERTSDRMVGTPLRCDSWSFARTLDNLEEEKSTLRSEP